MLSSSFGYKMNREKDNYRECNKKERIDSKLEESQNFRMNINFSRRPISDRNP